MYSEEDISNERLQNCLKEGLQPIVDIRAWRIGQGVLNIEERREKEE